MVSPPTYRKQSRTLLKQAYLELENEDLCQASEKGWGAAAHMVKAVAEFRQWEHSAHWHLRKAVDLLAKELEDKDILATFNAAGELHINFYECWLSSDTIEFNLDEVARLVDKVEAVLPS